MNSCTMDSPLGPLQLLSDSGALWAIHFPEQHNGAPDTPDDSVLQRARYQLQEYFAGTRRHFDLPLAPRGSPFQQQVWQVLQSIPYGELRSYRDIALALRRPTASRAVGAANGRNPLPIVIPCHRVIGSNGQLTGYAGGLDLKHTLLCLEGAQLQGRLEIQP
ncbi:methylated-DNA--[protein]-cysteine S-methyltransferase [Kineobactrum salinum]|uniref:Methylated-DNA--protein-cysteine methyltransferase n=1 Tax=Kineobactrum salinum TaxID=2708301 RepID=A0A6C0U200_9GAMM|nr:methylated-DNA--[protein]-cysteine S-methyltransferase [Kineobactrum salinum]QIB66172.1 methylated-DNA--[protein]-cysteine S-methyltransferase [Kineobactrum salinum]